MKTKQSTLEVLIYFSIWISSCAYSLYRLYLAQNLYLQVGSKESFSSELKPGWPVLGKYQDVSDMDWLMLKFLFINYWFHCICNFLVSEVIRYYKPSLVSAWYIVFLIAMIATYFSLKVLLLLMFQPVIYLAVLFTGFGNSCIWIISIIFLVSVHAIKYADFVWDFLYQELVHDEQVYLTLISLGWIELRCMSFCLDYTNEKDIDLMKNKDGFKSKEITMKTMVEFLSYVLYFPTFFLGPHIIYEDFKKSFDRNNFIPLKRRLRHFVCNIPIFVLYVFLMDCALHHIYFLAMQSDIQFLKSLPGMALCGGGLWMGIQFQLKYVISYGISGLFANLDNIEAPPTPRCIARIHLYSQMWKYFDVGLYKFLVKYIYKPVFSLISREDKKTKTMHKLIARLTTFVFIFFWHGITNAIFVWSCLNFLGVTLESLAEVVSKTSSYKNIKNSILKTEKMQERFKAFLCTPMLMMSALSNFYLFAGFSVGTFYVQFFLSESFTNLAILYVCLYSCCQVSEMVQDVPSRMANMKK